jgi:tRNA pseudouridine55 synthase
MPVSAAVDRAFRTRTVESDLATDLRFGRRIPGDGTEGVYAAVDADGTFLALVTETGPVAKPVFVWQAG